MLPIYIFQTIRVAGIQSIHVGDPSERYLTSTCADPSCDRFDLLAITAICGHLSEEKMSVSKLLDAADNNKTLIGFTLH